MPKIKKSIKSFTLGAPAKLNLALQITGRRKDGFHTLNTVFERISLADRITFSPSGDNDIHIACSHPAIPLDGRNLVHKAALALRKATGVQKGARIFIQKNIPVAAGLAGGSSNAATALLGLNKLWDLGLSHSVLIKLAREIGSDVAFFLYDTPFAQGTDRGDKIKKLAVEHKFWHVLITAKQPLLTKDVYGVYAAKFLAVNRPGLTKKTADVTMLIRSLKMCDVTCARGLLFNDLEGPIGVLRPALLKLKSRLNKLAQGGVCFSGSGPSVFALTATRAEAEDIAKIFRRAYKQVFVVQTA
jgi:4-diphosphocytidyl-2-C-methyl-D-erythritol kinase